MNRAWFTNILAVAALLFLSGCTAAAPTDPAHPPMWEVRDADTRIILIGSVHQLPANVDWMGGEVGSAIDAADELWLELSPDELARAPALFDQLRHDEPVLPLAQRVSPQVAAIVRRLAVTGGFPANAIDDSESWALTIAVGRGALATTDLSADNGVEARLIAAFKHRQRPIAGLERAEDQLYAFDQLSPSGQDQMLAAAARRASRADSDARHLVAAWAVGDDQMLARIAADGLADTPALAEPLVYARNRRWARLLIERLHRPGTVLVAVGTGHLVGDQSLPTLLQRTGADVRRLARR